MALERDQDGLLKAPALAGAFRAVRGELHGGDDADDLDDTDISQIQQGSKAVTGKAVWSANSAARMARDDENHRHEEEDKRQSIEQARELAHLAAWNVEMTTVGGVAMTNAEAQDARQHIIDHADFYADKAVREGRIREDEKEEYKSTIQRIHDLEDKRGHGSSTKDEDHECERLKASRVGQTAEQDAGEYWMAERSHKATADASAADGIARHDVAALSSTDDLFQSAPDATAHFKAATLPPVREDARPVPSTPDPRVAATGLSL